MVGIIIFFRTAQQNIAGEQRNCELNGNEDLIQWFDGENHCIRIYSSL